jgi:1,4-dihydroxy-2-naphthoyl-CoA synthase
MNRLQKLASHLQPLNDEKSNENIKEILIQNHVSGTSTNLPSLTTLQLQFLDEHTLSLKLNRPNRLNALDATMRKEFHHVLDFLHQNNKIRVVILSGNGRGFCAGLFILFYFLF